MPGTGGSIAQPALGATPKTREGAVQLYDEWAATYDDTLRSWNYPAPRRTAEIMRLHVDQSAVDSPLRTPALPILDVGCGTGLSGEALHDAGFSNLVGSDVSDESLELCRKKGIYQNVVNADLECSETGRLSFEDHSFAGIACVGVLSYVQNFEKCFSEWCRITAPGGLIVFTHRTQLWDEDADSVRSVAGKCPWVSRFVSEPEPYMPNNPDPVESAKKIRYFVYEVQ